MSTADRQSSIDSRGLAWGFFAYTLWGFFPLYWRLLRDRSSIEILAHRMVWSFAFYSAIFLAFSKINWREIFRQSGRDWLLSALAALLLAINWGIYIYAVNSGHVLESSLAYFINPIFNVAVGIVIFKERFPRALKLAVLFAALGVGSKIFSASGFPWIALSLASSFCAYGITKKILRIPALTSSVLEGAMSLLPAIVTLLILGHGSLLPASGFTWFLFIASGVVTGLPLFLFSFAAQRVPYSIMGMMQFIAPSLQFLVAILVFKETFDFENLISFGLIWIGSLFYFAHQILLRTKSSPARKP